MIYVALAFTWVVAPAVFCAWVAYATENKQTKTRSPLDRELDRAIAKHIRKATRL